MTFDEAKALLARVAVLDNRNVDGVMVKLWQEILDPFSLNECMWALRAFARTNSQDYLRPAHLTDIISRQRRLYAEMNPERAGQSPDAWLTFESEIEQAARAIKEIRAERRRTAVEAMEADDGQTDPTGA